MRFRFKARKLEMLYTHGEGASKYSNAVIEAFFEVMNIIDAAEDEQDLYTYKSLRYKKLKGKRKDQHSLRLNDQFRLVVQSQRDEAGKLILVIELIDYH